MTRSYKSFRKEGFSVRPDVYNRKKNGEPMTSDEKQGRDRDVEKESKEDFSSLLELRDVFDELNIIRKLFQEQRDTLSTMVEHYKGADRLPGAQSSTTNLSISSQEAAETHEPSMTGLDYLRETEGTLDIFEKHVTDMIDSATKAEKAVRSFLAKLIFTADCETQYSNLLDIKQKQANVDESRLARFQIDATAAQGRSILVFTIFTIIFVSGYTHS